MQTRRPLTISDRDDRAHVNIVLTPAEARAVTLAAGRLKVATWCRWAVTKMAEVANAPRPTGGEP